jgi:hypothetical protein
VLITTLDVETGEEESTVAAGVEAISGAVREWLGRFEQIGSRA